MLLSSLACRQHGIPTHKIVPGLEAKVKAAQKAGRTWVVIYGDCCMDGQLDVFLDEQDIQRILGPICYNGLWAMPVLTQQWIKFKAHFS